MRNWKEFYLKEKLPTSPSDFAQFCLGYMKENPTVVDIGCGNGRDSEYFREWFDVNGVDPNSKEGNFTHIKDYAITEDVVYSRFFLHTITPDEVKDIIRRTPNTFMAECRAIGDEPTVYTDHDRYFVDPEWLKQTLIENGFNVVYFYVGRNVAVYKGENPLCLRIIAKR